MRAFKQRIICKLWGREVLLNRNKPLPSYRISCLQPSLINCFTPGDITAIIIIITESFQIAEQIKLFHADGEMEINENEWNELIV